MPGAEPHWQSVSGMTLMVTRGCRIGARNDRQKKAEAAPLQGIKEKMDFQLCGNDNK